MYRWTDASGREHFTSDATQVPAGARATAPGSEKVGGFDEAGCPRRVEDIRSEIALLEPKVEECRKDPPGVSGRLDRVNGYTVNRHQLDRTSSAAEACGKATSQLSCDRTQIERLEESARKLGVSPGWLR